jgi:competence protein ComEA
MIATVNEGGSMMRSIAVAALLLVLHTPALAAPAAQPAPAASAEALRKIDVNRATAAELVAVPGIGERLAQAIIELRERRGSFTKLDDLLEVRGIGEKNLAQFGEYLMVAQKAPAATDATALQKK